MNDRDDYDYRIYKDAFLLQSSDDAAAQLADHLAAEAKDWRGYSNRIDAWQESTISVLASRISDPLAALADIRTVIEISRKARCYEMWAPRLAIRHLDRAR